MISTKLRKSGYEILTKKQGLWFQRAKEPEYGSERKRCAVVNLPKNAKERERKIDKGRGGKSPQRKTSGRTPERYRGSRKAEAKHMYIPRASGYIAIAVTIAERIHLFSYRTQKLSSLTPKVLGLAPGRIGSCRLLLPLSSVGRTIV